MVAPAETVDKAPDGERTGSDSSTGELATPPVFIAFDMLPSGGRDLRVRPLCDRRPALEDAIAGSRFVLPALRLESHGLAAWGPVKRAGWECLVAKDEASTYVGGSTRSWLKVKVRHEGRFVVIGLDLPLAGSCSLLLAARVGRRLVYVGRCEWGVGRRVVAGLRESLALRVTPASPGAEGGRSVGLGRAASGCRGSVRRTDARQATRSRTAECRTFSLAPVI